MVVVSDQSQQVGVRRAPKLGVFLLTGAALGAIGTLILTGLFPADPNVGFFASFAYFCVFGIPAGVLLGAVVGLLLDWRSRRRVRMVTAERQDASRDDASDGSDGGSATRTA